MQLEEELTIVKWYHEVMEGSIDKKLMIQYYNTAKQRVEKLKKAHSLDMEKMQKENNKIKSKLAESNKQLKKLFNECLKPLISEVKLKDEIIERYKTKMERHDADLKMLLSIVRIPRLCTEFQRASRRK